MDAEIVGLAIVNTILGGCGGGLVALGFSYMDGKKWSYLLTLNGALTGNSHFPGLTIFSRKWTETPENRLTSTDARAPRLAGRVRARGPVSLFSRWMRRRSGSSGIFLHGRQKMELPFDLEWGSNR